MFSTGTGDSPTPSELFFNNSCKRCSSAVFRKGCFLHEQLSAGLWLPCFPPILRSIYVCICAFLLYHISLQMVLNISAGSEDSFRPVPEEGETCYPCREGESSSPCGMGNPVPLVPVPLVGGGNLFPLWEEETCSPCREGETCSPCRGGGNLFPL